MTAPYVARRLLAKYGREGAKRKVFGRLLHWTLRGHRVDPVTEFVRTDFWLRVGATLSRASGNLNAVAPLIGVRNA